MALLLLAQGVTAREAAPAEQAAAQESVAPVSVQRQPAPVFTPIDVQTISSELDIKLELTLSPDTGKKGEWRPMLVSID
jgi:hypothetical protein